MNKYSSWAISILLVLLFQSCSTGQNKTVKVLEKGKIIPEVICKNDQAVSYAAYLPSTYNEKEKYPIIIAFDPHAAGSLPLENYKSLAEKYQTILIGSNNSKNGLQLAETQKIISSLFEDIESRFPIDTTRVYVMGFSGGARVASLIALYRGGVQGLIACGAGLAGSDQPARFRFDYIGFAGNEDFNMNEMISLDEQLENANFRHDLFIFQGKHEWPPVEVMEYAFIWNRFNYHKDRRIELNRTSIADFMALVNKEYNKGVDAKNQHSKAQSLQHEIRFLKEIAAVDKEHKELAEIKNSEEWKKEEKRLIQVRDKEMQEQKMFIENFYNKGLDWWKEKIKNYELRITKKADSDDVLMCKRIKSYLSLIAYMQYTNANSNGDKEKAAFALEVYKIVDPENAAKIK